MSTKNYLLPGACYPSCVDGTCNVYIAGQSTQANVYDPISEALLEQPLNIDSNGFLKSFIVSSDYNYDVKLYNYFAENLYTLRNLSLVVASGTTDAPQGNKGDKGDKGDPGQDGTDGLDGNTLQYITVVDKEIFYKLSNSASAQSGGVINIEDGVSLVSIQLIEDEVVYNLSDNPNVYISAGKIPGYDSIGMVKAVSGSPLVYANDIISVSGDISAEKDSNGTLLTVDLTDIRDELLDHEERITTIESEQRAKQVLYGGTTGGTSVTIPHTLGTSNLGVTCYDNLNGGLIFLNVVVTDSFVSITDLAPLQTDNQIKIVLIK